MDTVGITELVRLWAKGDRDATDLLFPMVCDELRRIDHRYFQAEGPGRTLKPAELVHDLYLKRSSQGLQLQDSRHFYAVSARQMRHLLVDHARAAQADKRGGAMARVELLQDPASPAGAGLELGASLAARALPPLTSTFAAGKTESSQL